MWRKLWPDPAAGSVCFEDIDKMEVQAFVNFTKDVLSKEFSDITVTDEEEHLEEHQLKFIIQGVFQLLEASEQRGNQ